MPLISVIVPVYNTEDFLDECIGSILAQEFSDFELLLIDDGSTDRSLSICLRYEKIDTRVRVLQQPNQGVSVARNRGIDTARGEWLCFVDSDDKVMPDYLSAFVEKGVLRSDCLNQQGKHVLCDGKVQPGRQYPDVMLEKGEMSKGLAAHRVFDSDFPHSKLFHRGLLNELRLRFDPRLVIREDALFVYQYRAAVSCVRLLPVNLYLLRRERRRMSLSHQIHPHGQFLYLKEMLPPAIARFMDTFSLWDDAYGRSVYNSNKSTIVVSGVKALYAHKVRRDERLTALGDFLGNAAYYGDPRFKPVGIARRLHRLWRLLPKAVLDLLLFALLKPYYRLIYFQKF